MRIGIYNAYLDTIGGGEKHMAGIIEYLQKKNNVYIDLISHHGVDVGLFTKKLNFNLNNCNLVVIDDNPFNLEKLTEKYDVFINATIFNIIKPQAKKNINLMFFPKKPEIIFLAKNRIFKKFLHYLDNKEEIIYKEGFYYQEKIGKYFNRKFGNWTKNKFTFSIISNKINKKRRIIIDTLDLGEISIINNIKNIIVNNDKNQELNYKIINKKIIIYYYPKSSKEKITVTLKNVFTTRNDRRELGVFITSIRTSNMVHLSNNLFILKDLKYYNYLDYYDTILTNSKFTQKWLKKLWAKNSVILYPLIESEKFFNKSKKENKIISVGRFFTGCHNKKHLIMIKCFKSMYDKGFLDKWEYHLCGGTHLGKENEKYLDKVTNEAKGYPIFIHPNISFYDLKDLYSKSKIFWHATGYGENENKNPDKFEHFGITTVEAMASGCIPIVIAKAGQLEIIEDDKNGFFWNNLDELEEKTLKLINSKEEVLKKIRKSAINKSMNYAKNNFDNQLDKIFNGMINF